MRRRHKRQNAGNSARTRARRAAKCGQFSGASNEPIFAAIGARGAAPRRLQCAIDDECTLSCTFLRFFIQKLCWYWADRATEGSLASKPMQGDKMRVFSRMCARFSGVVAYVIFCAKAIFGGLCYKFFGKQGWNLSLHCRACNWHQGYKTHPKNPRSLYRNRRTELRPIFWGDFFIGN